MLQNVATQAAVPRAEKRPDQTRLYYDLVMNVSDTTSDPRPRRFCLWLRSQDRSVATFSDISAKPHEFTSEDRQFHVGKLTRNKLESAFLVALLLLRQFSLVEALFLCRRGDAAKLRALSFQNVICSDLILMPLAVKLDYKNLIFDAREFYPRQFEDRIVWRLIKRPLMIWLANRYTSSADHLVSVSKGLCREYEKLGGRNVRFLPGYSKYADLRPDPVGARIRIVHHGHCNPSRHIEDMLDVADGLDDRFEIDFYFQSIQGAYGRQIADRIASMPNARLLPPVPSEKLIEVGHQYDIGLAIFRPATFNLQYSLSNKIFEFIQSRCMLVCGYIPEAAYLFEEYDIGIHQLDGNKDELAARLNALSAKDIDQFKRNSDLCARKVNSEALRHEFESILA